MSARVFIHPICMKSETPRQMFVDRLIDHGYDINRIVITLDKSHGQRHELVRLIDSVQGVMLLERLDGTRYQHDTNKPEHAA